MRQELLVDLHPFTLQGMDHSYHIHVIPQRDSCRQQRQSTGAIALIFRFSVPDFTQPVQKYRTCQRITGFSFIQSRRLIKMSNRLGRGYSYDIIRAKTLYSKEARKVGSGIRAGRGKVEYGPHIPTLLK